MSGEGRGGTGRKQVVRGRRPQARPSVWREDLQTPTREPNDGDSLGRGPGGKGSWGRLLDAVRRQDATRGRWRTGGSGSKHGLEPAPCSGGERSQPDWKAGGWRGPTIISSANSSLLHHLGDPDPRGCEERHICTCSFVLNFRPPRAPEGHLGPQNLLEPSTVAPPRRARTPHTPRSLTPHLLWPYSLPTTPAFLRALLVPGLFDPRFPLPPSTSGTLPPHHAEAASLL